MSNEQANLDQEAMIRNIMIDPVNGNIHEIRNIMGMRRQIRRDRSSRRRLRQIHNDDEQNYLDNIIQNLKIFDKLNEYSTEYGREKQQHEKLSKSLIKDIR